MGTGPDAASAAYAKTMIHQDFLARPVVTVFYRTRGYAGLTINALFFINPNNRR
jgi:hypothetical protein